MRKVIGAINTTLDAISDHTAGIPDAELHLHYRDLLNNSDTLLYGRITYQFMGFEFQLCIHPIVAGSGSLLFGKLHDRKVFKLKDTKVFSSGAITFYYEPISKNS